MNSLIQEGLIIGEAGYRQLANLKSVKVKSQRLSKKEIKGTAAKAGYLG